jgi:hypothetical protein
MKIFLHLLQVLFIGLKLTNQIDWNWFFVLSPSLFLLAVILLPLLLILILKIIYNDNILVILTIMNVLGFCLFLLFKLIIFYF